MATFKHRSYVLSDPSSKLRKGHFYDVSCDEHVCVKMVLTRRTAAALDEQQLKEKTREPERRTTEKDEDKKDCTEHEETETHLDHTAWAKEDSGSSTERESFISLSGVDFVEGKSVKKKKRMKQELVTHDALPTRSDHVGRCALHCMH